MSDIKEITSKIVKFRDERDWKQFHNPKDLSVALSIEANELMELFLWKNNDEIDKVDQEKVKEELADVFSFALLLVDHYGFDLKSIIDYKYKLNAKKYPVEKSKGSSKKYNEL